MVWKTPDNLNSMKKETKGYEFLYPRRQNAVKKLIQKTEAFQDLKEKNQDLQDTVIDQQEIIMDLAKWLNMVRDDLDHYQFRAAMEILKSRRNE